MTVVTLGGLTVDQVNPLPGIKRRLAGKTQINNTGTPKRVAVFHQDTFAYLGSTISQADGTWELKGFPELPAEKILCVILDDSRSFDPIAFGNVSLVE